jgi:hypothetical protein
MSSTTPGLCLSVKHREPHVPPPGRLAPPEFKKPQGPDLTDDERANNLFRGWVCCRCKHAWTGIRKAGSHCRLCSHNTHPTAHIKCLECWNVVYYGRSEWHLAGKVPGQYRPTQDGWYCAKNGCEQHHLTVATDPKWCRHCEYVGPEYAYTRRLE